MRFTPWSPKPNIQLSIWAWFAVVFLLTPSRNTVHAYSPSIRIPPPEPSLRAALVSLVHESDLPTVLSSVNQLEQAFNADYQYDWVFFSAEPLSEDFRSQTSNATRASCLFEEAESRDGLPVTGDRGFASPTPREQPVRRRKLSGSTGNFAREHRMGNYDWFWRVEPGARFDRDIKFDVFRFMHDHHIAYGFTGSTTDQLSLDALSPYIRSFIDNNLGLLHKDAKIAVLRAQASEGAGQNEVWDAAALMRALLETDVAEQDATDDEQEEEEAEDEVCRLAEGFSSWLVETCGSTLHPNFELGSLAFLRSPGHQALLEHFEGASYARLGDHHFDLPVHSLSASMFLPKQSVWNFRHKNHMREPPKPTPAPERDMTVFDWGKIAGKVMKEYHAHWDLLAADFASHSKDPKTNLGHTAIDERNFLMTASNGRYLAPEECISCVTAIECGAD